MSMVTITRTARFNSAHRLNSPALSVEENVLVYGKCNNVHGHGHDYLLEVTVRGEPDLATGMVMNLTDLKRLMNECIVDDVDHRHLDLDVSWLRGTITTVENLAIAFWNRLAPELGSRLFEVKLFETPNNWATYRGE